MGTLKFATLLFLSVVFHAPALAQWNPITEYSKRRFVCDTGQTTLEITFCSGYKNRVADSLMNILYSNILKGFDKEIKDHTNEANRLSLLKMRTGVDSVALEHERTELDRNKRWKLAIISSQRTWLKLRQENAHIVSISSEGGTAHNAMVIQADTEQILKRMKELIELSAYY